MRIETFFHMLCSKEDNHETTLSDLCRSLSFAGPDEISEVDNLREGIEALCDLVAGSRPVRFSFLPYIKNIHKHIPFRNSYFLQCDV